MTIGYIEACLY